MKAGYIGFGHLLINSIKFTVEVGESGFAGQGMFSFLGEVAITGSLVRFSQRL